MDNRLMKLILLALFLPVLALAKENSFPLNYGVDVESLSISIKIDENGGVLVNQTFDLSAPTAFFTWVLDVPFSNLQISPQDYQLTKKEYQVKKLQDKFLLTAYNPQGEARRWSLAYQANTTISQEEQDNLNLILVSEPGVYIKKLEAEVDLPFEISGREVSQKIYAIHGVERSDFKVLNSKTLLYQGENLSPFSTFTISASFTKGIIKYPLLKQFSFFIASNKFVFWLVLGIILPALALLFYVYMLFIRSKDKRSASQLLLKKPPEDLPPAVLGVLVRERAGEVEIASTILDLARRGFIDIVKKREEYVLGKRKGEGTLRPFEAYLFDKLFTQQGEVKIKRTEFELEKRAEAQLFSPKVSKFYEALYREIRKRNLFIENPQGAIFRYRIIGKTFFLLAVITSLIAIKFSRDLPYALFGTLGQILAASLIIKTAALIPKRTREGREGLSKWFSFRNYLTHKMPFPFASSALIYEKYLPYAVALRCEIEWTSRFSKVPYMPPSWFVAEDCETLESFVSNLFYIVNSLSHLLYTLKEPAS